MEHTRQRGRAVIDALELLGRSLNYGASREHRVGAGAAVDVAWTAASHSDVPLFVFEVESSPSSGMANNALKVLGPSNDALLKPLFFFHVVLGGGPDNERVANLRSQWGQHNYRVYRLSETAEPERLLNDVLLQHRRVSRGVVARSLAGALRHDVWAGTDPVAVLVRVEELAFISNYLRDYALLSLTDEKWLPGHARRALARNSMTEAAWAVSVDQYGGMGDYCPGLLERSLAVRCGHIADDDGPTALEAWQTSYKTGLRAIGAHFGLSQEYDLFVLRVAPLHYAAAAAALLGRPSTLAWLARDMQRLLQDLLRQGVGWEWRAPTALWLAHIAAAGAARATDAAAEAAHLHAYESARQAMSPRGTATADLLNPPGPASGDYGEPPPVSDGPPLPAPDELRRLVTSTSGESDWPVGAEPALRLLTHDDALLLPGRAFVRAVHEPGGS